MIRTKGINHIIYSYQGSYSIQVSCVAFTGIFLLGLHIKSGITKWNVIFFYRMHDY